MKRASRLSDFMEELLAGHGLTSVAWMVRLRAAWPDVVGPLLSGKTTPTRLKNGVLTVLVRNHAWAQELQLKKPVLIAQANAALGKLSVNDIRFAVGPLPVEEKEVVESLQASGERLPPAPEPEGIAGVADPETRRILHSIARRIASLKR